MSIAVVTSPPVLANNNPAGGLTASAEGGSDFSALLLLQLASPVNVATPGAGTASPATGDESDPGLQDTAATFDPQGLLPALLANATPVPPNPAANTTPPVLRTDGGVDKSSLQNQRGQGKELFALSAATAKSADAGSLHAQPEVPLGTATEAGTRLGTANIAADPQANGNPAGFAAALAAQGATAAGAPRHADGAAPALQIGAPIHDARWAQDLGDKVVWLARNDLQSAQITITPPQLGPLQITLNLNGDQASALFVSPHAEVRQALQDAMPQLREVLAGAGINLGEANVGAHSPRQESGTPQQPAYPSRSAGDGAILHADAGLAAPAAVPRILSGGRGMVDLFA